MKVPNCSIRSHRLEVCLKAVEILTRTNNTLVCRSPHEERMNVQHESEMCSSSISAEHFYVPNGDPYNKSHLLRIFKYL